jgi:hypothetical protein
MILPYRIFIPAFAKKDEKIVGGISKKYSGCKTVS